MKKTLPLLFCLISGYVHAELPPPPPVNPVTKLPPPPPLLVKQQEAGNSAPPAMVQTPKPSIQALETPKQEAVVAPAAEIKSSPTTPPIAIPIGGSNWGNDDPKFWYNPEKNVLSKDAPGTKNTAIEKTDIYNHDIQVILPENTYVGKNLPTYENWKNADGKKESPPPFNAHPELIPKFPESMKYNSD